MLKINNLQFTYSNGKKIFEGFSLETPQTGLGLLQAPNGSGKTTLFKIISNLISLKKSEKNQCLTFKGKPINQDDVSLMSSNYNTQFFQLTGEELLKLFSRLNYTQWEKSSLHKKLLEIPVYQSALMTKFSLCSTGMKQILNFARSLTKESPILLLDEPFQGIDQETRESLYSIIKEISGQQLVIIATHENLSFDWDFKFHMEGHHV